jgi:hypothetical protein
MMSKGTCIAAAVLALAVRAPQEAEPPDPSLVPVVTGRRGPDLVLM